VVRRVAEPSFCTRPPDTPTSPVRRAVTPLSHQHAQPNTVILLCVLHGIAAQTRTIQPHTKGHPMFHHLHVLDQDGITLGRVLGQSRLAACFVC